MTKQEIFEQIEEHLQNDQKPSEFLNTLLQNEVFMMEPFRPLYLLSKTEQSPKYHPEGNAWVHTLMVVDEAAKVKGKSSDPYCFMWASFLHDIGKPETTAIRHGRITSYGHDEAGQKTAREFLTVFMADRKKIDLICALVHYHMHILYVTKDLPFAKVDQMLKESELEDVALLGWCDRMGRTNADEEEENRTIAQFLKKVRSKFKKS
ncbi:MAG: HDIG domain-containing protein [bacterium]|nr:HDIG domain-containing protein [bacterium]